MHADKFGYYTVGTFKTYSKVEATEISVRVAEPVTWHFNDEYFSSYPWLLDTKQDLRELYKQRAEQIRAQYDYVVVWYSGGADSFTVLNSFLANNIHVDEIAQFHSYEGEGTWDSYLNKEVKEIAIPNTLKLLEKYPRIKHRTVDFTPLITQMFSKDENKFDFIFKANNSASPHQLARTYFREYIPDYANLIASGKKVCFVWGADKPPITYNRETDRFALQFSDVVDSGGVGPRTQQRNDPGEFDEFFFWSPEGAAIMSRQAHIIKEYLRNPPVDDLGSRWLSTDLYEARVDYDLKIQKIDRGPNSGLPTITVNDTQYRLTTDGLHRLIYPDWDNDTFTLGKSVGFIFGPRDRWWHMQSAKDQSLFVSGVSSYYQRYKSALFVNKDYTLNHVLKQQTNNNKNIKHVNFKLYLSTPYYIE